MGVAVENLIQMSIWSYSEFLSVYKICKNETKNSKYLYFLWIFGPKLIKFLPADAFMKKVLKEKGNLFFKAVAVQICIAKVSEQKDFIESIE